MTIEEINKISNPNERKHALDLYLLDAIETSNISQFNQAMVDLNIRMSAIEADNVTLNNRVTALETATPK